MSVESVWKFVFHNGLKHPKPDLATRLSGTGYPKTP